MNSKNELLEASFHDVPEGEPELVQELLHPWSERSFAGRLLDQVRKLRAEAEPSKDFVFSPAVDTLKFSTGARSSKAI